MSAVPHTITLKLLQLLFQLLLILLQALAAIFQRACSVCFILKLLHMLLEL